MSNVVNEQAYKYLAEEIIWIREQNIQKQVIDGNHEYAKTEVQNEIMKLLDTSVYRFSEKAVNLYQIRLERLTLPVKDFPKEKRTEKPTENKKIQEGATRAGYEGARGWGIGVIGGGLGVVVASIFTGGLTIPAILVGAGAMSTLTAALGAVAGAEIGRTTAEGNTIYRADLHSEVPEYVAEICLTCIYALSHHGYAVRAGIEKTPIITKERFQELLKKVQRFDKNRIYEINWAVANENQIIELCKKTIAILEA